MARAIPLLRRITVCLRFQLAMGQTESLKKLRELRKNRARLLTILREIVT